MAKSAQTGCDNDKSLINITLTFSPLLGMTKLLVALGEKASGRIEVINLDNLITKGPQAL